MDVSSSPAALCVEVVVNGRSRRLSAPATIASLLEELELEPDAVAVELDRRIVRRPEWEATSLRAGARLEVVHFVGGG